MSMLRAQLNDLAQSFAQSVLAAIRGASLEDLQAEGGAPRRGPGRPRGSAPAEAKAGRLHRRTPEEIAKALDKVVAAIKATKGKGMNAEEIKTALKLDRRELPRVLREGLASNKLRSKGAKRATRYFAK